MIVVLGLAAPSVRAADTEPNAMDRMASHASASSLEDADAIPLGRPSSDRGANPDAMGVLKTERPGGTSGLGGGYLLSTAGALGLVIGLVLAARWAYVKLGGRPAAAGSPAVEVLSRTAVAPKNHVLLLRVGRRVLVVSDSGGGLRTLSDIDDVEEVADLLKSITAAKAGSSTQSFGGLIDRFNRQYSAADQRRAEGGDDSEKDTDATLDAISGLKSQIKTLGGKS
ncbi:MAG: flagellar biosynthetic protein FliO [Algisphaera sp.]